MKIFGNQLIGCCMLFAVMQSCAKDKVYEVLNPGDKDIIDLAVVLKRSEVIQYLPDSSNVKYIIVKTEDGELLPSQCDDINGDGKWDELAFLCDMEAGEKKPVLFEKSDTMPVFVVRTNIRFGMITKPFDEVSGNLSMKTKDTKVTTPVYQMEGPAWENDMIAFRNYFDARNGIDIFGKRTGAMVMDSVGVNGRVYHILADWGMDILKVGNSLGAGAIALGIGDSLYRIGPCEERRYRFITEGPVRAVFELSYKNVPAGGRLYQVTHQISIYAGDHFYRSKVWVNDLRGDEDLVTGIVNMHDIPADTLSAGRNMILYSLGKQGISGEVLGMGILFPAKELKRFWEAPATGNGVVSTHLVSLALKKNLPVEYCFLAAWETRDPQVKDAKYFKELLQEASDKIK